MSSDSTGGTIVERMAAAFNASDVDAFADCFAADAVQYHPFFPEPMRGRDAIRAAEGSLFASFEQVNASATRVLSEADWVAVEFAVSAVNTKPIAMPDGTTIPATGRTVNLTMAAFLRLDADGQIVEANRYQDNLGFLRALGLAP